MLDVFISYARADEKLAAALQTRLEEAAWTVWRDARLESGEDFREQIQEALDGARVTIVLWSRAACESRWVRSEASRAANHNALMAARLEDVTPPLGLDQFQATSLVGWQSGEDHPGVDTLLQQLAKRLGRTSAQLEDEDARTMRRLRRRVREAKVTTLLALAAAPLAFLLHGSGVLDGPLQINGRLRLLSVQARYLIVERLLDERIAAVIADASSIEALKDEQRAGERVGAFSANWRALHAEVLTRLVTAGAKSVAFDVAFPSPRVATALAEAGTRALAEAIRSARQAGVSVAIAALSRTAEGELAVDPRIREALLEPVGQGGRAGQADPAGQATLGQGHIASPCVGFEAGGAAVVAPVLITHEQRPQPGLPSLSLAAAQGLWGLQLHVAPSAQALTLSGPSGQRTVPVAGYGRPVGENSECLVLRPGDRPVHQILDLYPDELERGHERVIPFERALSKGEALDVKDKLVVVGTQLSLAGSQDRHWVFQCGATPWSCGPHRRWGINLQVDMVNNLLRPTAVRTLGPFQQLMMMLVLCMAAGWLRLSMAHAPTRTRRMWLSALVALDLAIAVIAGAAFQLLMDSTYHVLAMVATYAGMGRLDKRRA